MTRLALALLLTGCGPRFYDCPAEAATAHALAVEHLPSDELARVDVFCRPGAVVELGVACRILWHGSALARARWEIAADIAGPCVLHEARHAHLREVTGDSCADHEPACDWDADDVERLVALLVSP